MKQPQTTMPDRFGPFRIERDARGVVHIRRGPDAYPIAVWGCAVLLIGVGALYLVLDLVMHRQVVAVAAAALAVLQVSIVLRAAHQRMTRGVVTRVKRHFAIYPETKAETYRDAPTPTALRIDGRDLSVEAVKDVRVGHSVLSGDRGERHVYTVYVVCDDEVYRLHDFADRDRAVSLGRFLEQELALEEGGLIDLDPIVPEGCLFPIWAVIFAALGLCLAYAIGENGYRNAPKTVAYLHFAWSIGMVGTMELGRQLLTITGIRYAERYVTDCFGVVPRSRDTHPLRRPTSILTMMVPFGVVVIGAVAIAYLEGYL